MAEGPVIHFYANQLRRVLEGKKIIVECGIRKFKAMESTLKGLRVTNVEALGKQIRIHLSDKRLILVHLMMWGSWRVYRLDAQWDKPTNKARLVVRTEQHAVVAFSAPVIKLLTIDKLNNDSEWGNVGPDPLRRDFSAQEFMRRIKEQHAREIGEVLLDQTVNAGIGNILRIEILFYSHIHPRRKVADLTNDEMREILLWTMKLMSQWLKEMGRKKRSWRRIYRKRGKPCPVCGSTIEFFRQARRLTFACPACQK
jgi:endonuclease-8